VQDHRVAGGAGVERCEDLVDRRAAVLLVAGVDHDRQLQLLRHLDLTGEGTALLLRRGGVAVEVEPGLADRPHLRVAGQADQLGRVLVAEAGGVVGMAADAGEDSLVALGGVDRDLVGVRPEPDREDPPHPGLGRRRDQLGLLAVAEVEVGVGVDQGSDQPTPAPSH
jgi:hypothetical protein